jgi:diguanylate cyclase (GGDEF)-like protein
MSGIVFLLFGLIARVIQWRIDENDPFCREDYTHERVTFDDKSLKSPSENLIFCYIQRMSDKELHFKSAGPNTGMDLISENRLLRQRLHQFAEEARNNEAVLMRFHEREIKLLTAKSLPELLYALTDGMLQSFGLSCLSLVLEDADYEIRHLLFHAGTPPETFPLVHFTDQMESVSPIYIRLRNPWLGSFMDNEHGPLFPGRNRLKSVVVLPMVRRDRLIGSLNLGSQNPHRFTQNYASDFLSRLGTISAVCLENATNRERLVVSGLTDALTGLFNRRYLQRRLKGELARASRYSIPLSCLFIDADHFKRINDTHGHPTGDRVLQEMAHRIRTCLRASDIATRYGGEEFALILPNTRMEEAAILAQRIRREIADRPIAFDKSGRPLTITVSVGVSETLPGPHHRNHEAMSDQILADADAALYEAKLGGRDRVAQHS